MNFTLYKEELFKQIITFNQNSFIGRKGIEDSFKQRFYENPFKNTLNQCAFIYDENSDEILGQFLVMGNEFHFQEKSYSGIWGFDFILEERLRGQKKGKTLAEATITLSNYCVQGVSKASEALHYKFGNKKLATSYRFIRFLNIFSLINVVFKKKNFDKNKVEYPQTISIKQNKVEKVIDISKLPDKNFWNKNSLEWGRSRKFLTWRFFEKTNKYSFYLEENQRFYLVVRKVRWKNLNVLLLVDYRYNNTENDFKIIYNFAYKIAKKTNCSAVITVTSREDEQHLLKKNYNIKFGEEMAVMTTCNEVFDAEQVSATFADSDSDTFYGDNVW